MPAPGSVWRCVRSWSSRCLRRSNTTASSTGSYEEAAPRCGLSGAPRPTASSTTTWPPGSSIRSDRMIYRPGRPGVSAEARDAKRPPDLPDSHRGNQVSPAFDQVPRWDSARVRDAAPFYDLRQRRVTAGTASWRTLVLSRIAQAGASVGQCLQARAESAGQLALRSLPRAYQDRRRRPRDRLVRI